MFPLRPGGSHLPLRHWTDDDLTYVNHPAAVRSQTLWHGTPIAHADTLGDLQKPSSTIAGCVNDWGPFDTGDGVVEPTCGAELGGDV